MFWEVCKLKVKKKPAPLPPPKCLVLTHVQMAELALVLYMKCTLDSEILLFQSIMFVELMECLIFLLQLFLQFCEFSRINIFPVNVVLFAGMHFLIRLCLVCVNA